MCVQERSELCSRNAGCYVQERSELCSQNAGFCFQERKILCSVNARSRTQPRTHRTQQILNACSYAAKFRTLEQKQAKVTRALDRAMKRAREKHKTTIERQKSARAALNAEVAPSSSSFSSSSSVSSDVGAVRLQCLCAISFVCVNRPISSVSCEQKMRFPMRCRSPSGLRFMRWMCTWIGWFTCFIKCNIDAIEAVVDHSCIHAFVV